jgi:hypothetical protein
MKRIDNINWAYIPSAKTNVFEKLKSLGWTPPSEDARFQEKWSRYRNALTINEKGSK